MYNNKEELLKLLKSLNIKADKNLGQNFLINKKTLDTIINTSDIKDIDNIVEIGPGLGILTKELLNKAKTVHSIELDKTIIPYLKTTFKNNKKFTLEQGSALKAKLPNKNYKLIANIPYYITSPILRHYLDTTETKPTLIVLLVQKEVAEKICAQEGEHSVLSLQTQIYGKPTIIKTIKANNFYPAPKVDSAIIKIEVYKTPKIKNTKLFKQLIKIAFNQKRKTLINTISGFIKSTQSRAKKLPNSTYKQLTSNILRKAKIDGALRPQQLTIKDWQNLINELEKI